MTYHFAGATRKGEHSTRRVSKGAAIVNDSGVKYIRGDDVLQMLDEKDPSINVLHFGNENYTTREIDQALNLSGAFKDLPTMPLNDKASMIE